MLGSSIGWEGRALCRSFVGMVHVMVWQGCNIRIGRSFNQNYCSEISIIKPTVCDPRRNLYLWRFSTCSSTREDVAPSSTREDTAFGLQENNVRRNEYQSGFSTLPAKSELEVKFVFAFVI